MLAVSYLVAQQICYEQSATFSLKDISVSFPRGEIISIIGPNGSGKSTFMSVLTNLLKQDRGTVMIDGKELSAFQGKDLARKLTMLSQVQASDVDLTVYELISHGRLPHHKWYERLSDEDDEIINWAIAITNLEHLRNQSITRLSGGERQRAWIAMAIVQSPEILILDEPTTYLDISHQLEVMELVSYLNTELKMTIIMVLHDINQAAKYSDKLIVMRAGQIIQEGTPHEIIREDLFRDVFAVNARIILEGGVPVFWPISLVDNKFSEVKRG